LFSSSDACLQSLSYLRHTRLTGEQQRQENYGNWASITFKIKQEVKLPKARFQDKTEYENLNDLRSTLNQTNIEHGKHPLTL